MFKALNRKSFIALYLSILRPHFVMAQATNTTFASGSLDAGK